MRFTQDTVNALLQRLNIVTLADIFRPPTSFQTDRSSAWFNVLTEWMARFPNLIHPSNPHSVFLDHEGKFQLLFFAAVHTVSKKVTLVATVNINPSNFELNPMVMDLDIAKEAFLGLCTRADAETHNLVHSKSSIFDACKFPKEGPPASAWFKANGFPDLDLANKTSLPVVAAFPKILVTTPASFFPSGVSATTAAINEACDTSNKSIVSDLEFVWYKAVAFSATHLGSRCLSGSIADPGVPFSYDATKTVKKAFQELALSEFVCLTDEQVLPVGTKHSEYNKILSFSYEAFGTLLTEEAAEAALEAAEIATAAAMDAETRLAALEATIAEKAGATAPTTTTTPTDETGVAVTNPTVVLPTGDDPAGHPAIVPLLTDQATVQQILLALVNSQLHTNNVRSNPTETPDSSLSKQDDFSFMGRKVFYQFLYASVSPGDALTGGLATAKAAELNPLFELLLRINKKANRHQALENAIRSFQATYGSPSGVSAFRHACGAGQLLDQAFVNAIYQPYWLAQMSNLTASSEYFLLFGSFGPPPASLDPAVNKRKHDELVAQRQRDNEVFGAHIRPEPTSLYVRKVVDTDGDLTATFGNFETFVGASVANMYAADGSNMPSVIAMTTMIFTLLINENGRAWTRIMFDKYSNFGEFIMTRMNSLVMMYVAIAHAASAVHQSKPVPNVRDYDMVEQQFHHLSSELQMAISILGEPHTMRGIPRTVAAPAGRGAPNMGGNGAWVGGAGAAGRAGGLGGGGLGGGGGVRPPYMGRPATPAANLNGVVCLIGPLPVVHVTALPPGVFGLSETGDQLPLCLNHLRWGRDCHGCYHRFHMNHLRDLPAACVPTFRTWMTDNSLVFVNARLGDMHRAPAGGGRGRGRGRGPAGRGGEAGRGRGRGPPAPAAPVGAPPPVVG
jgi:hypothetical protein